MIALGNRVHIFARPNVKEKLTWCFTTVLGGRAAGTVNAPGLTEPILAFAFPNGGSLSVEFSDEALDEPLARRGAWLEVKADDPAALKQRILEAGFAPVKHPATDSFYFAAPGGQILRIT